MLSESYAVGPMSPAVEDKTIGQMLEEAALDSPDRIGIIAGVAAPDQRTEYSYAKIYEDAQAIAQFLLSKFSPGDRVAVMAPNIPEWVLLEYGSALAGIVLVTVNPSYQQAEIAYVLRQSRSSGIFVLPEFRGNSMLASVEAVAHDCPDLREILSFSRWDSFLEVGRSSNLALPDVQPDDATMIQYTSGTTGFPKGVLLHHRGLVNNATHVSARANMPRAIVSLMMVPLFHTSGCVLGVLGALANRNTMVILESFDPAVALELIEAYRADATGGVPTMMVALLEHPDYAKRDLSSLKMISAGGSTVPAPLVKRLESEFGAQFLNIFGQTECSPVASMTCPDDSTEDKASTIGCPLPHMENKVIDVESGDTLPLNTLGEFCTRGYHLMHGYFDMPEETAATIDEDGWLHTGDLCSMDERGYCKIEGRLKDMIIRGGENIYPKEIENVLFKHPSVGEVAVVGLPDDTMGELVGAFIRPAPGEEINKSELFTYIREHLSPQKTPAYWVSLEDFPLTGSGKIQKFELSRAWQRGEYTAL